MQNLRPDQIEQIAQIINQQPAPVYQQVAQPRPIVVRAAVPAPAPRRPQAGGRWMAAVSTLAVVLVAAGLLWQMFGSDVRTQTPPAPQAVAPQAAAPALLPAVGGGVPAVVEQVQETAAEVIEAVVEEAEEAGQPADVVIEASEPILVERVEPTAPAPRPGIGASEATSAITAGMAAVRDQQPEETGEQWAHFYQSNAERAVNELAGEGNPGACNVQPPAALPPNCD